MSKIPVPSRYRNLSDALQRPFDQIEDYLAQRGIEFDLFGLSQRPNFHGLMQLIQVLCKSVSVSFSYSPGSTVRMGVICLNELLANFNVPRSFVDQDLIRLTNSHTFQALIKALATLVTKHFVYIYQVEECSNLKEHSKQRAADFIDKISDVQSRVTLDLDCLAMEARLAQVDIKTVQQAFSQNIQKKHDAVDRLKLDVEVMQLRAEQSKKVIQENVCFVEQTLEIFKNEELFGQHMDHCVQQYNSLLKVYRRLCVAYRAKKYKEAADKIPQFLSQISRLYLSKVDPNGSSVSARKALEKWKADQIKCKAMIKQEAVSERNIQASRKIVGEIVVSHQKQLEQVNLDLERINKQQLKLQEMTELTAKLKSLTTTFGGFVDSTTTTIQPHSNSLIQTLESSIAKAHFILDQLNQCRQKL